ncbi:hypothetical protein OIU78_018931 [Salix suchowensis]|nr:hypothetical protein OIU78_018931 [Salix suchowensis]
MWCHILLKSIDVVVLPILMFFAIQELSLVHSWMPSTTWNLIMLHQGHYAHVIHPVLDQINKPSVLELSKDMIKDQTYFLSHLTQAQLRHLIFPLGCIPLPQNLICLTKTERIHKEYASFEFVARHIGESEGIILEAETGDFLGFHRGFWFYTIGQRQGLRLPGGPWYVVEKDVKNNVVFVSRHYFSLDKRRRSFRVGSLKWLSGSPPDMTSQLQCKVRHGPDVL